MLIYMVNVLNNTKISEVKNRKPNMEQRECKYNQLKRQVFLGLRGILPNVYILSLQIPHNSTTATITDNWRGKPLGATSKSL